MSTDIAGRRIAVVVQRYGLEVNGGAEVLARWLAEHLAVRGAAVTVMTTRALDYVTWADHFPPGESELNSVAVRRYPVDEARDWRRAQRQTARVMNHRHTLFDEVQWAKDQGPYSTPLLEDISHAYRDFDAFIFFTFHYATTLFGLPLVSDKAYLVPTAHDDPFLHLAVFRPLFHLPRGIFYNTEPERALVQRVVHNANVPWRVAGMSVDAGQPAMQHASAARFREKYGVEGDFLLYVGRIHESKNVPELLDFFARYRDEYDRRPLKLVLLGKSHLELPQRDDVVALGFVSDEDKYDAVSAATLVVLPSLYESLSIITLESWAMGRPVLVNERCEVVKHLCKQSNAGLYYSGYDEFAATLQLMLDDTGLRRQMGRQGRRFVMHRFGTEEVLKQYTDLLDEARRS